MMTIETGHARRPDQATAVMGDRQGAKARRVDAQPGASPPSSEVTWSKVGRDRYEVRRSGETLGFIDVEGGLFVALAGDRYDRAVEASQTLGFDDAVRALEDRHPSR